MPTICRLLRSLALSIGLALGLSTRCFRFAVKPVKHHFDEHSIYLTPNVLKSTGLSSADGILRSFLLCNVLESNKYGFGQPCEDAKHMPEYRVHNYTKAAL